MKIPYGRSNFADVRRGGFYYVDKTPFIPLLVRTFFESVNSRVWSFLLRYHERVPVLAPLLAHIHE